MSESQALEQAATEAEPSVGVRRLYISLAVGLLALTQAPWAHVSIRLLGSWSPPLNVKATEMGSLLTSVSVGTLVGALALAAGIAALGWSTRWMFRLAIVEAVAVGYHAITAASNTTSISADGLNVDNLIGARVTAAWGAWASLLAAAALLLLVVADRRHADEDLYAGAIE